MKTLIPLLTALLCTTAALADVARPVLQSSTTKALTDDLATGAKKIKITATGTLEFASGFTLTGGSYLKTALTLNNVENTAMSTWAGSANVITLGTITTGVWHGTPIGLSYLASGGASDGQLLGFSDGEWIPVTLGLGLTVGTTSVSGGTSGRLLMNNGGLLGELDLGSNVATALGNAVNASSGLLTYGMIGTSGTKVPLLDAANTFSATQTTRDLIPSADNTYSLGAAYPGNRYINAWFSNSVAAQYFIFASGGGAYMYPLTFNGKNAIRFTTYAGDAFSPLLLGPANSSFPALDNSGSTLLVRLGDDSGYAPLKAGVITANGSLVVGSTGTTHTKIKSGVATLVAGTATISDSDVLETGTAATSSRILITRMTDGGTLGTGYSITRVNATSFTVTSSSSAETSTVSWLMLNP